MDSSKKESIEITILFPCLNEEETIGECIEEAWEFLNKEHITGEILVVDNGSTDRSAELASAHQARVVTEDIRGYGSALRRGIREARGAYIIMADADMSYPLKESGFIYRRLKCGSQMVIGNRFNRNMEEYAMKWLHQYIGVPFLSWIGRKRYGVEIKDFHCGMRGIQKSAYEPDDFRADGMEFATEMIAVAKSKGHRIGEADLSFRRDKRSGCSHLRSIRDGLRHLKWMKENDLKKMRKKKAT